MGIQGAAPSQVKRCRVDISHGKRSGSGCAVGAQTYEGSSPSCAAPSDRARCRCGEHRTKHGTRPDSNTSLVQPITHANATARTTPKISHAEMNTTSGYKRNARGRVRLLGIMWESFAARCFVRNEPAAALWQWCSVLHWLACYTHTGSVGCRHTLLISKAQQQRKA